MKLFIGIDPGKSGGIALIFEDGMVDTFKMPESDKDLIETLSDSASGMEAFAIIEKVGPMPKQGVVSVWTFGEGYGKLLMALCAAAIPYERVLPAKWQKAMGCLSKGDKNTTKRKAQELFPNIKVTHAIADALLIAEYNRRTRV